MVMDLVPCDVLDFVDLWPVVQRHPAVAIVAAVLKEPAATHLWRKTEFFRALAAAQGKAAVAVEAAELCGSIREVLEQMSGRPNHAELNQLVGQGFGCELGLPAAQLAAHICRCGVGPRSPPCRCDFALAAARLDQVVRLGGCRRWRGVLLLG